MIKLFDDWKVNVSKQRFSRNEQEIARQMKTEDHINFQQSRLKIQPESAIHEQ